MRNKGLIVISLGLVLLLCSCGGSSGDAASIAAAADSLSVYEDSTESSQPASAAVSYPEPPESDWVYTLSIYWAFNTGGSEYPGYAFSADGIIEEGVREDPGAPIPAPDSMSGIILDDDYTPPGGIDYDFRGVAPGDVTLTITSHDSENDKLMSECVYIIRVYDDLRLAVLDETQTDYR